jgi:hypothetical protein
MRVQAPRPVLRDRSLRPIVDRSFALSEIDDAQAHLEPDKHVGRLSSEFGRSEETMKYEHILVEKEDGVGIVTLNRPEKLNAMNRKLSSELRDAVKELEAEDAIGCIVITGAGNRAFSAGGDIHEQREDDRRFSPEELDARRGRGSYEIAASAKPTIGMINGLAYGGAAVLASSLDSGSVAKTPVSVFSRPPMAGSTAPGHYPTRSAGRSPRNFCLRRGSSKPTRRTASGC